MTFFNALILLLTIFFATENCLGQLTAESVARRPCTTRAPFKNANLAFVYNPLTRWYVNYGSPHLFRSYAEVFLGRPAANEAELNSMNLRITLTATLVSNTAFGNLFFQQICTPILDANPIGSILSGNLLDSVVHVNCTPIAATASNANMDLNSANPSEDTLLYTDNASVLVLSRCIGPYGTASEDWKIFSTTPTVEPTLLSNIITNLTSMGLDTSNYLN